MNVINVAELKDDESGEPANIPYHPWYAPEHTFVFVTESQCEFLRTNIQLFLDGKISEGQAKLNESNLLIYGWRWADKNVKWHNEPLSAQILRELRLKKRGEEN
jgi:hypothetical protein